MKLSLPLFLSAAMAGNGHAAQPRVRKSNAAVESDDKPELSVLDLFQKVQKGSEVKQLRVGASSAMGPPDSCGSPGPTPAESAVYTMTNQPTNEIVVFSRNPRTGKLTLEGSVATGGAGGILLDTLGPLTQPTQGDPLGSSSAVRVAGECLIAVNAGSNEISTFRIISSSEIQHMGNFPSGGIFPVSTAEKEGLVYVLNAGGLGSIQGFSLSQSNCGLTAIEDPIALNQNAVAGVPDFELSGPSEIAFTPEGNLVVVLKTDGGGQRFLSPGEGALYVYEINQDGTASGPTITSVTGRPASIPFAVAFDRQGRLLLAEAVGAGLAAVINGEAPPIGQVSVWEYGADGTYTEVDAESVAEGGSGTCWIRYSERNSCVYATNANTDSSVSSFRLTSDGIERVNAREAEGGADGPFVGLVDFEFSQDEEYLYALVNELGALSVGAAPGTGVPTVVVFKANCDCGLVEVERIALDSYSEELRIEADGRFNGFQGMAVYN